LKDSVSSKYNYGNVRADLKGPGKYYVLVNNFFSDIIENYHMNTYAPIKAAVKITETTDPAAM